MDLVKSKITHKRMDVIGYGNIAGIDTQFFSREAEGVADQALALRRKLNIGDTQFVFCFIGRLNRDKGVGELVEAFRQLPESARLLIVGAIDTTAPTDARTLAEISGHEQIHYLGHQDDVRAALAASNVLVLPSYREGFPNVILQAGSMCVPTIASDISGCNEVIAPSRNGWLVQARSVEALLTCMKKSMDVERRTLTQMGEQARVIIKERFERAAHWERMHTFYTGCIKRSGI